MPNALPAESEQHGLWFQSKPKAMELYRAKWNDSSDADATNFVLASRHGAKGYFYGIVIATELYRLVESGDNCAYHDVYFGSDTPCDIMIDVDCKSHTDPLPAVQTLGQETMRIVSELGTHEDAQIVARIFSSSNSAKRSYHLQITPPETCVLNNDRAYIIMLAALASEQMQSVLPLLVGPGFCHIDFPVTARSHSSLRVLGSDKYDQSTASTQGRPKREIWVCSTRKSEVNTATWQTPEQVLPHAPLERFRASLGFNSGGMRVARERMKHGFCTLPRRVCGMAKTTTTMLRSRFGLSTKQIPPISQALQSNTEGPSTSLACGNKGSAKRQKVERGAAPLAPVGLGTQQLVATVAQREFMEFVARRMCHIYRKHHSLSTAQCRQVGKVYLYDMKARSKNNTYESFSVSKEIRIATNCLHCDRKPSGPHTSNTITLSCPLDSRFMMFYCLCFSASAGHTDCKRRWYNLAESDEEGAKMFYQRHLLIAK